MSLESDDWVVISTVQGQFEKANLRAFLDGHDILRTVAIKVLPEHVAADPDLKQRFEREARAVALILSRRTVIGAELGRRILTVRR